MNGGLTGCSISDSGVKAEQPRWLRGSVSVWNVDTLDREQLRREAKQLRDHPGFEQAKRQFAQNMLHAFETCQPLNRLLRGEGELAFLAFVLALHHRRDLDDPDSGATYSRILDLFAVLDVGSPTLVKALLALTRIRGFLRVEAAGGKKKRLVPTDYLLDTLLVWMRANLTAVELIISLPEPAEILSSQPEMLSLYYRFGVDAYRHNRFILSEDFPPVRAFMTRSHGYPVLMAVIASMQAQADGRCTASAPSADLAGRLSVSRGTVRNILNLACRNGWIGQMSRGSRVLELNPVFAELCDDWISMELVWMGGVAHAAWLELTAVNQRYD